MNGSFSSSAGKILIVVGTRPEMIKLAPVVRQLASRGDLPITVVSTAQQADLLPDFVGLLGVRVDYQLHVMAPGQPLNSLLARTVAALDPVIEQVAPGVVVVQGDTTSALAGALAARMRAVPVAHIEAGLRTGDSANPFPEESNRRLISHVAALHCAPTQRNRAALISEGIAEADIVVTGNPVVAALDSTLARSGSCPQICAVLTRLDGLKPIVLTTHRRESLGATLTHNLRTLRAFVEAHKDTALVIPVHLNPKVKQTVELELAGAERIELLAPLDYPSFLRLLQAAWLVVSDSGGVQEEVASLGKPLLVLRSTTERPEAVETGIAKLAGERPGQLAELIGDREGLDRWIARVKPIDNPFGDIESPARIADALVGFLARSARRASLVP